MSDSEEMTDVTAAEETEEIDFLSRPAGAEQIDESAADPNATEAGTAAEEEGKDLVDEADLKGIMANFNPVAIRDIATIEKGVEHFFLFNNSHLALIRPEQLQHLTPPDLEALAERNAIAQFQYLEVSPENRLYARDVVVRPSSLKADQVRKVKQGCIYGSAVAILRYLAERDRRLRELEQAGDLSEHVSNQFRAADGPDDKSNTKQDLTRHLKALRVFSFEYLLEQSGARAELIAPVFALLKKKSSDLEQELALVDMDDSARGALLDRMNRQIIFPLTRDYHLCQPPSSHLVDTEGGELREMRSEIEWIHLLFTQIARRILKSALPKEETEWIEPKGAKQAREYLATIKQHPSLSSGEAWDTDFNFAEAYENLLKKVTSFKEVRLGGLVDMLAIEALKPLNMNFEPYYFSMDSFEMNHALVKSYSKKEELYGKVLERIQESPEVYFQEERRSPGDPPGVGGLFLIFNYNLPRAFINHKSRRNFLHLMARSNGHEKGIYDLLRSVKEGIDPPEVVKEQIELSRAIREWEEEAEKERARQEKKNKPFFARIADWFLGLFGIKAPSRRADDKNDGWRDGGSIDVPGKGGVIGGPREKELRVPGKVQKAADAVERANKGLIWLDLVLEEINSTKYDEHSVGDFLHYDREDRYTEVRSLVNLRRVFIRKDRESDPNWLRSTIDYLDNISRPGPEIKPLREFLRNKLDF